MSKRISIWKDTSMWKTIRECLLITLIILGFLGSLFSKIFLTISGGLLILSVILDTIYENAKMSENDYRRNISLVRRTLGRVLLFLIPIAIVLSVYYSYPDNKHLPFFVLAVVIIAVTLLIEVYRKQTENSGGLVKYLFGETTPLFSREFFQESGVSTILFTFLIYAAAVGYIIWYIIKYI